MGILFRREPKISRKRMFASVPVRNPSAEVKAFEEGIRVTLTRDQTRMPWYVKMMPSPPPTRTFELDAIGALVWDLCDGSRTVAEIADALAEEKKLEVKEAEVALVNYLRMLVKRGIIGIRFADEAPEGQGAQQR
jgi:hypothetical protein